MILTNSSEVTEKDSVNEEKAGKWSLSTLYTMLRIWLGKLFQKRDQVVGFEQNFYAGKSKTIIDFKTRSKLLLIQFYVDVDIFLCIIHTKCTLLGFKILAFDLPEAFL